MKFPAPSPRKLDVEGTLMPGQFRLDNLDQHGHRTARPIILGTEPICFDSMRPEGNLLVAVFCSQHDGHLKDKGQYSCSTTFDKAVFISYAGGLDGQDSETPLRVCRDEPTVLKFAVAR